MSSRIQEHIEKISALAQRFGYKTTIEQYEDTTRVSCRFASIVIVIDILCEHNISNVWGFVRTTSWEFEGERTDLHEVISTVLAIFFRTFPEVSCGLWVVPHPAVAEIKSEIYARDIIFAQPDHVINTFNDLYFEQIEKLLCTVPIFWNHFWDWFDWPFCSCEEHKLRPHPPFLYSVQDAKEWARTVAEVIGEDPDADGVQFNARYNPTWKYYRSINSNVTVLLASEIAENLAYLLAYGELWKTLDGPSGRLYISKNSKNIISFEILQHAQKLLSDLEGAQDQDGIRVAVPLETHFVIIGTSYLLFIEYDCGKKRSEEEIEKIRKRHVLESKLLFPITAFRWSEAIDGDEFELFISEILSREPGVKWLRKVSTGREPDNGRDLIAEWRTPPLPGQILASEQNPYTDRHIIVQCKGFKKNVGKSDVTDIRDTIEHYDAQGYFLAVSSYLTSPLTGHLEKLRNGDKYWVDWWTRTEIEEKLRGHPDIVARFPNIVKVQS